MKRFIQVAILLLTVALVSEAVMAAANSRERRILDGATISTSELNTLDNVYHDVTCSVAGAGSDQITATVQFQTVDDADINYKASTVMWLSTDAYGDTLATTANDPDAVTVATDGTAQLFDAAGALTLWWIRSEADGDFAVTLYDGSNVTRYLWFQRPNGRPSVACPAINFD